jgi:hypothetical protein
MLNELGDEAANVGLVAVTDSPRQVIVRALEDPTIKSRADAKVRRETVAQFMIYVANSIAAAQNDAGSKQALSDRVFDGLRELSGGLVRVGIERSAITNNVQQEADLLYKQLISPVDVAEPRQLVQSRDPLGGMRRDASAALVKAFRSGYGKLDKKKVIRSYEVRGAKHKNVFDLVVRRGSPRKRREDLFQHLLVLPDAEDTFTQAAGLCWRWDDVRAANHAERHLTAVLYHRPGISGSAVPGDALKILKQERISVVKMVDVPSVAQKYTEQQKLALESHARQ